MSVPLAPDRHFQGSEPIRQKERPQRRVRRKPFDVRRHELMNAARQLFLEKGIAATSVEDITLKADTSKGTFYFYFPSKDDVIAALREDFLLSFVTAVDEHEAVQKAGTNKERLSGYVDAIVSTYVTSAALHEVLFHTEGYHSGRKETSTDNPLIGQLIDLLESGTADGEWDVSDYELTAVMLYQAAHGVLDHAIGETGYDEALLKRVITKFFFRTVGLAG